MLEFGVVLRETSSSSFARTFFVFALGKSTVFFFRYGGGLLLTSIPRYNDSRGRGRTIKDIRATGVVVARRGTTVGYVGLEVGA